VNTKPQPQSASDKASGETPDRKRYATPRLRVYGDLADITQAHFNGNKNDGGTFLARKTTP